VEFELKLPVMEDRNLFSKMGEFREFTLFELGTKEKNGIYRVVLCIGTCTVHLLPLDSVWLLGVGTGQGYG